MYSACPVVSNTIQIMPQAYQYNIKTLLVIEIVPSSPPLYSVHTKVSNVDRPYVSLRPCVCVKINSTAT